MTRAALIAATIMAEFLKLRETPVDKGCDDAGSFEKARLALNASLDFVRSTRPARAWRPEKPIDRIKKLQPSVSALVS